MDEILGALAAQHAELGQLLTSLEPDDWTRDTPCEGWKVADVVVHLAQTDELAIGSVEGRFTEVMVELAGDIGFPESIDAGADLMVARDRDLSTAAVQDRWRRGSNTLRGLLANRDLHDRVTWVAGELSLRTLATTRLAECWIHTGDVATAIGRVRVPTNRLRHIARLAWRTVPYAFELAGREPPGPVAFELTGPDGDEWSFHPAEPASTVISGAGVELCRVAARRVDPRDTTLRGEGPDADAVLELVRTYA
ncbi:MAG: maleylpyruvate isomerase family mycothiol-dependent enzyme [Acidimicrobiia bacterium]